MHSGKPKIGLHNMHIFHNRDEFGDHYQNHVNKTILLVDCHDIVCFLFFLNGEIWKIVPKLSLLIPSF